MTTRRDATRRRIDKTVTAVRAVRRATVPAVQSLDGRGTARHPVSVATIVYLAGRRTTVKGTGVFGSPEN